MLFSVPQRASDLAGLFPVAASRVCGWRVIATGVIKPVRKQMMGESCQCRDIGEDSGYSSRLVSQSQLGRSQWLRGLCRNLLQHCEVAPVLRLQRPAAHTQEGS